MEKTSRNDAKALAFFESMNRYIAQRKKLDLEEVYNRIKDKYPVVLTNTFALENGREDFDEDHQVLYGVSSVGRFLLYDNGLYIVFDVDKADGSYTHWHPIDIEETIHDVNLFMEGISKY